VQPFGGIGFTSYKARKWTNSGFIPEPEALSGFYFQVGAYVTIWKAPKGSIKGQFFFKQNLVREALDFTDPGYGGNYFGDIAGMAFGAGIRFFF
jgi:hypothetical protein